MYKIASSHNADLVQRQLCYIITLATAAVLQAVLRSVACSIIIIIYLL